MNTQIIYTNFVEDAIDALIDKFNPSSIFVLVDHNTQERVLPRIQSICKNLKDAQIITIKAGDENKNIESLGYIWKTMSDWGATRNSLLINLGGGMITDIGAFAASTFKRGIKFINVPTTLLSAVDAAIGGKTGINFNGFKNEVGSFKNADAVIISTTFLGTLPPEEIKSGYAEMLKHALITDKNMVFDLIKSSVLKLDPNQLLELIEKSNEVKNDIVSTDPFEQNIRKALNFGHTVGHAFESISIKRNTPIPHGYAVAFGMIVELILSSIKYNFPNDILRKLASYIYENYNFFPMDCSDYDELIGFMKHDKKNHINGIISMTLLKNIGEIEIDTVVNIDEIKAAFDIYREELQKSI